VSRALFDVTVLVALLDSDHVDHRSAGEWLDAELDTGWASCSITENGFVRIISQPRDPSPVTPAQAVELLSAARETPHHAFWPCDVSLLDPQVVDRSRLHGSQVTDAYLLALAVAHDGRFVTFERSLPPATCMVRRGSTSPSCEPGGTWRGSVLDGAPAETGRSRRPSGWRQGAPRPARRGPHASGLLWLQPCAGARASRAERATGRVADRWNLTG
jgi:toxin-antitoxin system PIN domain toxin